MPLSNTQYQSILRMYEEKKNRNQALLMRRREEVYHAIPEYYKLHQSVAGLSTQCGRLLLSGDENAVVELKQKLQDIDRRKEELLLEHGYPKDYLEPVYDCSLCEDTGFLRMKGGKCKCFKQKEIVLLYEQSNIQNALLEQNFSTLSYDYYKGEDLTRFEKTVSICQDMVHNFDTEHTNLFLYGTVGTGKSFLSGCVAKELLDKGYSVLYFSATALFDILARYSFDYNEKAALRGMYEDLHNCDLIIIDDLGTEITNQFVSSQLFALLNERQLRKKSTIISTNLAFESLRDRYSDRLFSRFVSNFKLCKLTGKDIRLQKKLIVHGFEND